MKSEGDCGVHKKTVVALIDSGINTELSGLQQNIKKSFSLHIDNMGYIVAEENASYVGEHGTAVAMIIKHFCPDVQFISINIFQNSLFSDGRIMLCAIERAIEMKPDIIHMSLGTTKYRYKFQLNKLVKRAIKNNIIIVSATNNDGIKSYPADLKEVVGVKGSHSLDTEQCLYKDNFFYAPFGVKGIKDIDRLSLNGACGTSMSAGYITGHLVAIKESRSIINYKELLEILKENRT